MADAATRERETMDYLESVLDVVGGRGSKLLYAENFVYVDGVFGLVDLPRGHATGKGRVLYQRGICAD